MQTTVKQDIAVEALHMGEAYPDLSYLQIANLQTHLRRLGANIRHVTHKARMQGRVPDFTAIYSRLTHIFNEYGIALAWTVTEEGLIVTFSNNQTWEF